MRSPLRSRPSLSISEMGTTSDEDTEYPHRSLGSQLGKQACTSVIFTKKKRGKKQTIFLLSHSPAPPSLLRSHPAPHGGDLLPPVGLDTACPSLASDPTQPWMPKEPPPLNTLTVFCGTKRYSHNFCGKGMQEEKDLIL